MFIAGPDMRLGFRKSGSSVAAPFGGHATLTNNLISYWTLDETSGVRVDSIVAQANDLTDNNTVASTTGKDGNAAVFVAANLEYLSRAAFNTDVPEQHDRSVSFWFKTSDVTQVKGLMGVGETPQSGTPTWFLRLNSSHISIYTGVYTDGSVVLSNDTWYHAIYTYDDPDGNHVVYLNGASDVSRPLDRDDISARDDNLYIGVGFPGYFTGQIDEVGIWDRMLTAGEIADLYNSGTGLFY